MFKRLFGFGRQAHNQRMLIRSPKKRRLFFASLSGLLLIIVGMAVYVIQFSRKSMDFENEQRVAKTEIDSFDRILVEGNETELKNFAIQLQNNLSGEIAIQAEQLKQISSIASRILDITSDQELEDFAVLTRLNSKHQTQRLIANTNIDSINVDPTFTAFAKSNLNNSNLEISKVAFGMITYDELIRWRRSPLHQAQRNKAIVIEAIKNQIMLDVNDSRPVLKLISDVDSVRSPENNTDDFHRAIVETYRQHSKNSGILKIVKTLEQDLLRREYGLANLSAEERRLVSQTLNQLDIRRDEIISKISRSIATDADYTNLVDTLAVAMQLEKRKEKLSALAEKISAHLQSKLAPQSSKNTFSQLKQLIESIDSALSTTAIKDINKNNVLLVNENYSLNLILILDGNRFEKSADAAKRFANGFKKLIDNKILNFVVLLDQSAANEATWDQALNDLAASTDVQWARIPSIEFETFSQQFPTPIKPFWIVVDRTGTVKEIMTSPALLGARLPLLID